MKASSTRCVCFSAKCNGLFACISHLQQARNKHDAMDRAAKDTHKKPKGREAPRQSQQHKFSSSFGNVCMRFALLCTAALTKRAGKSGGKGKVQKPAFAKAHYGQSSKWNSHLIMSSSIAKGSGRRAAGRSLQRQRSRPACRGERQAKAGRQLREGCGRR